MKTRQRLQQATKHRSVEAHKTLQPLQVVSCRRQAGLALVDRYGLQHRIKEGIERLRRQTASGRLDAMNEEIADAKRLGIMRPKLSPPCRQRAAAGKSQR